MNGVESLSNDLSKADEAAMEGTMFLFVDHQQQVICLTLNLPQGQSSLFLAAAIALATSKHYKVNNRVSVHGRYCSDEYTLLERRRQRLRPGGCKDL